MGIKRLVRATLAVVVLAGVLSAAETSSFAQDRDRPQCTPGEIVSRRTRDSKTSMNEDCTFTTMFGQNLHYQAEPGRWEEVELRFRDDGAGHVSDRSAAVVKVRGARVDVTSRGDGRGIRWLLPAPASVAGHRATYSHRGLDWEYALTPLGLKLGATVARPRGQETYVFPYEVLGGGDLTVDEDGDLLGDGFEIPRAFAAGADGITYPAEAWRLLEGNRVAFDFDDSELPSEAYPYILDPTTSFSIAKPEDEGNLHKWGYSYPPSNCSGWIDTSSTFYVSRTRNGDGQFITNNGFMSWDTSSLPDDATVTWASTKIHAQDQSTSDGRSLTADWFSAWPIDCADATDHAQTSAIAGYPIANISTTTNTDIELAGYASGVSRTGRTGLRLHVSGGQPASSNFVQIWQLGNSFNVPPPQLYVTYSTPALPPAIQGASDSPDPVVAGQTVTFTTAWTPGKAGDSIRTLVCKTNAVTSTGLCAGGGWAAGNYTTSSPSTAPMLTSSNIVGTNTYYAFACEASGPCSNGVQGTFTVVAPNSAPTISFATDSPDPVAVGGSVSFSTGWSDPNSGDSVRALICRTNSVTAAGLCSGGAWVTGSSSTTSPASATYVASYVDVGTNSYYAFVCDQANACSASIAGTFRVLQPNAAPSASWVSDAPDPVTAGNATSFSVGWTDPNAGDTVKALVCRTNSVTSGGACSGGAWATGPLSSTSPAGASFVPASTDVGTHSYWAFVCDQSSACSSSLSGTFTVRPANAAPDIASVSDGPDPVVAGHQITFSVTWGDTNGDPAKTLVCKTNSVSSGGCPGGAWAESGSYSTVSPTQATYTTSSADLGTRNYFAFVCDAAGACSSAFTGSFVVSGPAITSVAVSPNPVSAGKAVTFNVSWADPGHSVRAIVCKTNALTGGTCQGGAWAESASSSVSPASASYTTTEADAGTQSYFAFVCNELDNCSTSTSGTFQVHEPPSLLAFGAYPNPFSPEGPSGRNRATIYVGLNEGSWNVAITAPNGAFVRAFSGTAFGSVTRLTWDGRDSLGNRVANGAYKVTLTATDSRGTSLSESLWLTVGPGPAVAAVTPSRAQIGGEVSITGSGFGPGLGLYGVTIGAESAEIVSWSDNRITAIVPAELEPGTHDLAVWTADLTSKPVSIEVLNYVVPGSPSEVETGNIHVRMAPGSSAASVAAVRGDSDVARLFPGDDDPLLSRWFRIGVPAGLEITKVLSYALDSNVEWATVDMKVRPDKTRPEDPRFDSQWGLHQTSDVDIDAPEAWDISKSAASVTIAVIDSGIGPHPDLNDKIRSGHDFVDGDGTTDESCRASSSHGTAAAGIAAAMTNNRTGIAGTGWHATLRGYTVFEDRRLPDGTWDCLDATGVSNVTIMNRAINDGSDIISMSFSHEHPSPEERDFINQKFANRNVIFVASAGNDGTKDPDYPAAYKRVLSVGAVTYDGTRAIYNEREASNFGDTVDVFAPGFDNLSTKTKTNGAIYEGFYGTSAAAPFVSGVAALLRTQASDNAVIASAIKRAARDHRLNRISAYGALLEVRNIVEPNGAFVRGPNGPRVWFIDGGQKRRVRSTNVLRSWGIDSPEGSQVAILDDEQLEQFGSGRDLGFRPGTLLATEENSDVRYLVTNNPGGSNDGWTRGNKREIPPAFFGCLGYQDSRVLVVSQKELDLHQTGDPVSSCTDYPNGTILRRTVDQTVWILEAGEKRLLPAESVVSSWGMTEDAVTPLNQTYFDSVPTGRDLGFRPGTLIRTPNKDVFFVTSDGPDFARGNRRRFGGSVKCYGLNGKIGRNVTAELAALHALGPNLPC